MTRVQALERPSPGPGRARRRWARLGPWRVPIVATGIAAVLLATQVIGEQVYGSSRIPSAVSAQLARHGSADIAVQLGFTPESFNLTYLAKTGNVVQTKGDTIDMSGVSASAVHAIAGQYWVRAVRSWSGS